MENKEIHKKIMNGKIGEIVTVFKEIESYKSSIEFFSKISDYGRKTGSILLESADFIDRFGELSIMSADPCLKINGINETFEIESLNEVGNKFLEFIKNDFDFCENVTYSKNKETGKIIKISCVLRKEKTNLSEEERLKSKTHMDILRKIVFKFSPTSKPFIPYTGLFGFFSYDFIDYFESLPKNSNDILCDPDYEFYFLDNLSIIDHKKKKMFIVSNALITGESNESKELIYKGCIEKIDEYLSAIKKTAPKAKKFNPQKQIITTDTTKDEFISIIEKLKNNIINGDVFQVVPSKTIITNINSEPLDIYSKLRALNPSPYMFYLNSKSGILIGSSPETFLRVQGKSEKKDSEKIVEIRPIAGTKKRGIINGKIDEDLDSRYETELKLDRKELAEHTMLVDLARNDVARISKPGTRFVNKPFFVEKYSHVQHLVSNVKGVLKDDLDALHAYLASMNMGTLTGAPKIEAMKLLRTVEKNKRGFYGGAIGYITPSGDLDTAIIIRTAKIKKDRAYIRSGAGIVYDSIPEKEFDETNKKAEAVLFAIKISGGFK